MYQVGDKIFKLQIWDMTGGERSIRFSQLYYRDILCCLLVFDLTDRNTFLKVKEYLPYINNYAPDYKLIILIGNKNDLYHERIISFEEADEFARDNAILYMECSALTGFGREEIINIMVSNIRNKLEDKEYLRINQTIQVQQNRILYRNKCY